MTGNWTVLHYVRVGGMFEVRIGFKGLGGFSPPPGFMFNAVIVKSCRGEMFMWEWVFPSSPPPPPSLLSCETV